MKKAEKMATSDIHIRFMKSQDVELLAHAFLFPWTSLSKSLEKWQRYHQEQEENLRAVCLVENKETIIGHGSLLWLSAYPNFRDQGIPEINDVWISEGERCKGAGTLLLAHLASTAKEKGYAQVGLGVGLYQDYGSAQKLYWKLGYKPDGHGITYKCLPVIPGQAYPVDDDLILWMTKSL